MNKQPPTLGRLLVMVAFALSCFGLLLFLWLGFGGSIPLQPKGYRYHVSFPEATQLAVEADVRISGVPVGKVKKIELGSDGLSDVTVELESRYAPLPQNARAVLRQKTLLGETYVEITPGSRSAKKIPEGGRLPTKQVATTTELDEIFRALDRRTRTSLQVWFQSQAEGVGGRGRDLSDALGNLPAFTEDTTRLLELLNSQQRAVSRLVRDTGTVFAALTEREGQLRELVENSNRLFETTARRDREIKETFMALPTFERESAATFARLDRFARNTTPLVRQLRPAARELSPTLAEVSRVAPELKTFFVNLNPLITASREGLPALSEFLEEFRPFLGQLDPFLRNLNPMLDYLSDYKRELTAFFANSVAATQASDDAGPKRVATKYLRTSNPLNPQVLAGYPKRIGTSRPNPYAQPGMYKDLKSGLKVYEDRHCGRPVPEIDPSSSPHLSDELRDLINRFVYAKQDGGPKAPECKKQSRFSTGGELTQYPQVLKRSAR